MHQLPIHVSIMYHQIYGFSIQFIFFIQYLGKKINVVVFQALPHNIMSKCATLLSFIAILEKGILVTHFSVLKLKYENCAIFFFENLNK